MVTGLMTVIKFYLSIYLIYGERGSDHGLQGKYVGEVSLPDSLPTPSQKPFN